MELVMPSIKKIYVDFEYKNKSFKISNYITYNYTISIAEVLFEIEDNDGNHINFFTLETICNNAKEKLQEQYPEFFI